MGISNETYRWHSFLSRGHKSQREDVTGRLTDAIVYLCILWGMIEEDKND